MSFSIKAMCKHGELVHRRKTAEAALKKARELSRTFVTCLNPFRESLLCFCFDTMFSKAATTTFSPSRNANSTMR